MTVITPRIPLLGSLFEVANNCSCIILEKNKSERVLCCLLFQDNHNSTYAANPFVGYLILGGKVKNMCCVKEEDNKNVYNMPPEILLLMVILL